MSSLGRTWARWARPDRCSRWSRPDDDSKRYPGGPQAASGTRVGFRRSITASMTPPSQSPIVIARPIDPISPRIALLPRRTDATSRTEPVRTGPDDRLDEQPAPDPVALPGVGDGDRHLRFAGPGRFDADVADDGPERRPALSVTSATRPSRWSWSGPHRYRAVPPRPWAAPWNLASRLSADSAGIERGQAVPVGILIGRIRVDLPGWHRHADSRHHPGPPLQSRMARRDPVGRRPLARPPRPHA